MTDSASLVERVLARIGEARVAVIGDFCVDHYLFVEEGGAEPSLETGLHTRQVGEIRIAPGGAGNVVNNLASLGVGTIEAIGVVGDDMYGRELTRILQNGGARTDGLIVQSENWRTSVYTKVYERGAEDPRLDIGAQNRLSQQSADAVLAALRDSLSRVDVLVLNEQIREALFVPSFRRKIAELLQSAPAIEKLVDSRDYADEFHSTVRKINLREARYYATGGAAALGNAAAAGDTTAATAGAAHHAGSAADVEKLCRSLSRQWGTPIVVTRGEDGCVVADAELIHSVPGVAMPRPVDPVGAGDALLAGMAGARALGVSLADAAQIGNLCAAVSVKKLFQTGTATPEELRAVAARPAFRMHPDLANAPEQARFLGESRIEIVTPPANGASFKHAIFDHDGTLSVLREGWEPVMQEVMVHAILGSLPAERKAAGIGAEGIGAAAPGGAGADCPQRREEVEQAVSELISDTTGIQTIEQMHALQELVRSFGCVAEQEIRSPEEYKSIYLEALHRMVDRRAELVRRGVLHRHDVTMKGAAALLAALRERGMRLYLASGSDHDAVVAEAQLLGYAELFDGGIFGSVGDASRDPKSVVLDQILDTIGEEAAEAVVTFGDGPVEIRETKRRGGTAVGVASDELRRHGLNGAKRRRLVLAGADLVIPDFAELDDLLGALFGAR